MRRSARMVQFKQAALALLRHGCRVFCRDKPWTKRARNINLVMEDFKYREVEVKQRLKV
jgi:hypothetical protein